jgi:hypothetical protein
MFLKNCITILTLIKLIYLLHFQVKLEFIAENTGGKIVEHRKAASLGNERLRMEIQFFKNMI